MKTCSPIVLDTKAYFMVAILIIYRVMKFADNRPVRADNFYFGV